MSSELEQKFVAQCSASGIVCQRNADGVICFSAPCFEVGDLIVYLDSGEITVDISRITHCHFTPYEAGPTYPENTADDCAHAAAEFVRTVLSNQRVLWRYKNGAGGTYLLSAADETSDSPLEDEYVEQFLWSGPYRGVA